MCSLLKPKCSVDGCDRASKAAGMCSLHYQRKRTHGDVNGGRPSRSAIRQIEAALLTNTDECIVWTGAKRPNGYGNVNYKGKYWTASRLSCFLAHGEPPTSAHEAAHSCGKGHLSCINPKHLRWATHEENMQDMVLHGTAPRGERRPRVVMREPQARLAKQLIHQGMPPLEIADIVGSNVNAVYSIRNGRSWAWL
jgi:hypothetical protein